MHLLALVQCLLCISKHSLCICINRRPTDFKQCHVHLFEVKFPRWLICFNCVLQPPPSDLVVMLRMSFFVKPNLKTSETFFNLPSPGPLQPNQSRQLEMFDSFNVWTWSGWILTLISSAYWKRLFPRLRPNSRSFLDYDHFIAEFRAFWGIMLCSIIHPDWSRTSDVAMRNVRRKTIITDFCCIFDGALPEIDTDQEEVRKDSSNLGFLLEKVVETCIF